MKPSEKITKRKYAILQNKLSNSKVKALTLEYKLESVKKDLIREKGNYQSLKEDMINFETTNESLREDIKDLKFQNLEDKVFLLEKIVRLYEDKPKDTIKYIDRPINGTGTSVTTSSSTFSGV